MRYCSHCGTQLADEAVICPKCGCPTELYRQNGNSYNYAPQNGMSQPAGEQLSALSIVGFIFAFLQPLVGLICSIVAYKIAVSDGNSKSKSFSKSGIILSSVFLVLGLLLVIFFIVLIAFEIANGTGWDYPEYYY